MSRQFPTELHIGQKVHVRVNPTAHPIASVVTYIDRDAGVIHVNPIGYKIRWQAKPRAVVNLDGEPLRYEDKQFFFGKRRHLA
jgi:hypothetical protein